MLFNTSVCPIQVEKVDEIVREKQRRTIGKEMVATQDQMLKEQRSREFALQKREKEMQKIERERLRAEYVLMSHYLSGCPPVNTRTSLVTGSQRTRPSENLAGGP